MNGYQNMGNFGGFNLFPPVIKTLIFANVGIFFIENFFLMLLNFDGIPLSKLFTYWLALYPIADGSNFQFWQVITYQFLHGSFMHLFFNMFVLWMFGRELEMLWGGSKFLTFYLLCGIGGAILHLVISPFVGGAGPTVGASGSIFGVMVAFALLDPNRSVIMFPLFIPVKIKYVVMFLIGMDLLMGFFSKNSFTAHFAHLGGAAAGWLFFKFGDDIGIFKFIDKLFGVTSTPNSTYRNPFQRPESVYERESAWQRPSNPFVNPFKPKETTISEQPSKNSINVNGEEITQQKIDEILDKISESGYQNLTEREKRILFELSQKIK